MLPLWRWLTFLSLCLYQLCATAQHAFENTAVVRTVELGGSVVHVTTTYAIKAQENGQKTYTLALTPREKGATSWLQTKVKGQQQPLKFSEHGFDGNRDFHLIDVELPKALDSGSTVQLVVEAIQTHVTTPWPATASQNDDQALKYTLDLFVLSPYPTSVQRTKVKALAPRIISWSTPDKVDEFAADGLVNRTGATVTYGPYKQIPPSANSEFTSKYQQPVTVHYYHDQPVLEIVQLKRAVEISHWGANLNTQDDIQLYNAGPTLKGHFSRIDHQSQQYFKRQAPHVLPALTLHLPPGIQNAYYYDMIGNVSTSHLRIAPSVPKGSPSLRTSVLEMRPRYPLLGGWNYTFTLGWDASLANSASYDAKNGKYVAEIPIMTPIPGAVVDDAEVKVILPEGATDVEFQPPFPAESQWITTHSTYLDTVGRPTLVFKYKNLTIRHAQSILVSYKVPLRAHLQKPLAVATAFFSLFLLATVGRRINLTINKQKTV